MPELSEVMSTPALTVQAKSRVREALATAKQRGAHYLVVLDWKEIVGVVCTCDLGTALDEDAVQSHMRAPPITMHLWDTAEEAARLVRVAGAGCFPVIDAKGNLHGIITRNELERLALLPNERGVDRCASCGTSHHLVAPCREEPVFCSECLEQVRSTGVRQMYFTLGGGD